MNRKCLQFITCLSLGMNLFLCTRVSGGGHTNRLLCTIMNANEPYGLITIALEQRLLPMPSYIIWIIILRFNIDTACNIVHVHLFTLFKRYVIRSCIYCCLARAILTEYTNYGSNVTTPFTKQFYLSRTHFLFAILHSVVFSLSPVSFFSLPFFLPLIGKNTSMAQTTTQKKNTNTFSCAGAFRLYDVDNDGFITRDGTFLFCWYSLVSLLHSIQTEITVIIFAYIFIIYIYFLYFFHISEMYNIVDAIYQMVVSEILYLRI